MVVIVFNPLGSGGVFGPGEVLTCSDIYALFSFL